MMNSNFYLQKTTERGDALAKRFECASSSIHYMSILQGTTRGEIYVDNIASPRFAIVYSFLLGGFQVMGTAPTEPNDYVSLRMFFDNEIISKLLILNDMQDLSYSCDSTALLDMMRVVFYDKETYEQKQCVYKYVPSCSIADFSMTSYAIRRLDSEFVSQNETFLLCYSDEICASFDSIDDFLKNSIGYVALDGEAVIGNLLANGKYKNAYILGAETCEEYRRKGIASSLLRSAMLEANRKGFELVWECAEVNTESVLTVEKCGFKKVSDFVVRWFDI